ncbi:MAG: UDP-glucose 4-epimerase GalE [Candidatus Doudnabacteria bacterium]|nr:UDP-glucose 4-epimerase GalE [Candidatus Doudnabacteria bacterium]
MGKLNLLPQQFAGTGPKILVTGGAGYIGSHAARHLIAQGCSVVTLDNLSTGKKEFAQGKFIKGDLADRELLDEIFTAEKIDAVMHFAASIEVEESVHDPGKYYRNNVFAGLNLLEAMAKHGVKRIVFSSTCTVYDERAASPLAEDAPLNPTSPYAETKLVFEHMLFWYAQACALQSVTLRYFNAAGASMDGSLGYAGENPTHLIPNILNVALGKKEVLTVFGNDFQTHDGTTIRDFVHVEDLAAAHYLALDYLLSARDTKPIVEVFNVGTGQGHSVLEIINEACDRTGHMIRFEVGPRRAGDRERVVADPSKISKVLGFVPKYSDIATIIDSAWRWHKAYFK